MKKKLIIIALLLSGKFVFSQNKFQQLIGGSDHDRAQTVFNTFDNRIMINGASFSFGAGNVDAMLIKLDSLGQTIWSKTYGTTDYDNSEYAFETFDHSIVCAGRSNLQSGFPTSAIIFKTDSSGNLLWSKSFGGLNDDGLIQIIETSDGGYAAIGNSSSLSSGLSDILLIRTNGNGDTLFTRSYGSVEAEGGSGIIQLPDNGFIIAGRQVTFPGGTATADALLLRTDSSGNLLWSKQYGDSLWEEFTSVKQTSDGGFVICGSTVTFGAGSYDILLVKTDSSGIVQWSKTFGDAETDAAYDIHILSDSSGFVISGYTESLGYGHTEGIDSANIFLMKTDLAGNLLWMEVYGDGLQDEGFRSNLSSDGGFLISGFTKNYLIIDSTQMLVIKTDNLGLSGCHEQNVQPVDSIITMPFQNIALNVLSGLPANNITLTSTNVVVDNDDACLFNGVNSNRNIFIDCKIFPNPFFNNFEIVFNENGYIGSDLVISDCLGKTIKSMKVNASTVSIDTKNMIPGVYVISVIKNGKYFKGKLVLKN